MADLSSLLHALQHDPDDAQALAALTGAARSTPPDVRATQFASTRKLLSDRGRPDAVVQLLDIELANTNEPDKKVDLLLEKGMLLDGDLLDVPAARTAFEEVLRVRPDDSMAKEALGELDVAEKNWQKFAAKYIKEASASTDRSLATGLYSSAAEHYVKFAPEAPEAEAYLNKALEIDPKNTKAAFHLSRLLRRSGRWPDLMRLLDARAEASSSGDEKIAALLGLADVARDQNDATRSDDAVRRVLAIDPAQPQALRAITDAHASAQNWPAVVSAYQAALKARRDDDLGILLQIAMVLWKHVGDLDQAEEYFRRVRKLEPAHPAALDFYRAYYPQKGEQGKLLQLLRSVEKVDTKAAGGKPISIEIATLAEQQNNPEKAIEAWKQQLRADPSSPEAANARAALARLYRRTEKWNALLDLMKEEIDRLPADDLAARVAKQFEIVEIYRDKLRLDVMVINTYNAILKLDPENKRASDELAQKFRALGRWNDLIAVLTRKSEAAELPDAERVPLLREVADLWSERFGNFANAIKPLERLLEIAPADPDAIAKLKEIYTRRRQWRALIDVLGREANALPSAERRVKQGEMARLAAERLGDTRLAIEIHNTILGEDPTSAETLAALAALYDREKRWLALAEILHRQVDVLIGAKGQAAGKDAIALLEKLGNLYADRIQSPSAAATAWRQILDLEPGHAKALRTLRELYATAGDFAGLESLYAKLGQEDELVDALLAIADRLEGKAQRLPIVERAAQLAHKRADAAAAGDKDSKQATSTLERARQVWERVLAVDPQHVAAASALAPIYAKQEKWARLIAVYEIELAAAPDKQARLSKIGQIRELCEQKLSSKNLAFQWTLRAFEIDPTSEYLFSEALRLASEPDQWRELASVFERHAAAPSIEDGVKLRLYRELARIASRRLADPERARNYHRQVVALAHDDRDAEQHLEELAIQLADWPELLASYRRRAAREKDPGERVVLLLEIAQLQEEKLVDLDGAAATYREALTAVPGQLRALRALSRIEEARGDFASLVDVLAQELSQTADNQVRFDLLMRLGRLEEQSLEQPAAALAHFIDALATPPAPRPQAIAALTRLTFDTGVELDPAARVASARLVLPHLQASKQPQQQATALEIIRAQASAAEQLDLDRTLMRVYHIDLGDAGAAWTTGLRVMQADPADSEVRTSLGALAGQLGRDGEWAKELGTALAALKGKNGPKGEIKSVATELAKIAGERLGDRQTSERAWLSVLEVEPDAPEAFEALISQYRAEQRWTDLRALLERRAEVSLDNNIRKAVLLELAMLEEDVLGQPTRAIAAHRRVLDLDPTYLASYQALDRLLTAGEQWKELEELLSHQVDHAKSPREQTELAYRRAELFAHRLGEPTRSVDLLDEVVTRQRSHADARELLEELLPRPDVTLRVARLLEPLYETDKLWKDLVAVLRAQRSLATGTEAVELLSRIATIEEAELGGARNAFDAWTSVLGLDPTHERARVELVRLARSLQRWPEATQALETAAAATPASDIATRGALLSELASYYDTQLGDTDKAITAYRRLLESDGQSPQTVRRACAALARLYEDNEQWGELRAVMRKQSEWAEDGGERRALLAAVAALEEERLNDRDAAIATWRDILSDLPTDAGALHALERLYWGAGKWRELIEILRRKLEAATDAGEALGLLARIAQIHETNLSEPEEAIAAYLEILERHDNDQKALAELARLYRTGQRYDDLLDILEKQAQTAADGERAIALHVEIAKLLAGPLKRPVDALDRWSDVVHVEPRHPEAIGALEAALDDLDLRAMAAEILRPVYDATSQDDRLSALHLRVSEWSDDPTTKLRALQEVVRLREHRLIDKAGAFEAQLAALRHAATEPELALVVAETERLAGELGREGDLIDAYRAVAPHVLDAEIQRRLHLDIADLARAVRRDPSLARDYYQKVLDTSPDDRRALAALESIYRDTNDDERLTEVLLRQADAAGADIDDRVGALVEAAGLYVTLKRPDDAIATWEQVLAVAPERRDAVDALESLYRAQGRWPDVVDLYERRLGFATTIEEAVDLRVQLGDIHEKHLHDAETAIDNYAAALGGDPSHAAALAAVERYLNDPDIRAVAAEVLEPIYVASQRWQDLIKVYEARLEGAADPRERLRLTRFVARLYEEQLEDFENASRWYAKVFREAPSDPAIRDQLQRLASMVDNWAFVAETYQAYLDDEQGETPDLRDVAIAAASIYDRRLGDVDRAYIAYRRALAIDSEDAVPDSKELVRRLEELLGRAQKWNELVTIYDDVIARSEDTLRREALVKRARLLEDGLQDQARAIEGWREVVLATESGGPEHEHGYREAVAELERLYRARSQWTDLVQLYEARLSRAADAGEAASLRLKLAGLFETQLNDLPSAIDQYEQVIADNRQWDLGVQALERLVVHETHRERIAEILEPVYRREDWWQKLVVILDAKLEYIHDPTGQIEALHEIAQIHEERGGALDLALIALARAWRIDVADDKSLTKLLSLAAKLEAWDDVATTLEEGAQGAPNSELASSLWARAAEIHEAHRGDHAKAVAAWRKVEEARPDDMTALSALDRLLALMGKVDELVLVVARRADLSDDNDVRLVLLHRVAALYEEVLVDKPHAITAYRNVLSVDDSDLAALDALERLYRDTSDWRELAATLERKIELTTDLANRQELRHAAAKVYEQNLDDIYQAIGQLTQILDDDPADAQALAELDRIYAKQKMWPDLLEIIDKRSLLAAATTDRADFGYRAARLVETELSDVEQAIPRYGSVLQLAPAHADTRAALESLLAKDHHVETVSPILETVYRADRDAAGLIRVYERRLAVDGVGDKRADWASLAEVHETIAGKPADAFAVWGRAITAEPDNDELLKPLFRIAETENLWRELASKLDELLTRPLPAETEQLYATRLGEIAQDRLSDNDRAAIAFERASHGPEPRPGLLALERVLTASSRWHDLSTVLRRQADAAENDDQTAEYLYRLGELQETTLRDSRQAVAAYREVLALSPKHPASRAALERMLGTLRDDRSELLEIVEVLEPLFEQDGDAARLSTVLEARLRVTDDALDKAGLLSRLVEITEEQMGDRARALDAALRWLAIDPASGQALSEIDRLAERLGQWKEVADRVAAVVASSSTLERDVSVNLYTFLGRVQHDQLGQLDAAVASYRAALALDREASAALTDLIRIHRQRGDNQALADSLRQRGQIALELPERRQAFAEVAQISERAGDRASAIAAWREIADRDDTDRGALDELARIYRGSPGDRPLLLEALARAADLATTPADEKAVRVEIAQLETEPSRAVVAWQAVVDLDPEDLTALGSLEAAHATAGDWMAVADIQTRRLQLASSTSDKLAIHAEMARLAEIRRKSIDDAIASWFAALDVDNTYKPAYAELERLLAGAERWHDLVDLLVRLAELEATMGDHTAEIHTLARAADVWESKLDDPDAAGEILEKILAREPGSVAALTRLSKIYERSGDWAKCKATLEQALALEPTGRDAADLFYRLGEVARVGDSDAETAILHFQQALRHDPMHADSIAALEKLARERRDSAMLADMLARKVATLGTPQERVTLLVEIAELERKAGRNDAALEALARASSDAPNDVRVLGPLGDLYFAAGRLDEAAPIFDRLAEEAKAGRRMKDVARFRQRQGSILDVRGDRAGALTAYEEALRINPTDVGTMTGLGRLYFAAEEWEKARKIYQSLVLQNIDPDAGVTKAEVYWALGKIHLSLGQPPKAKSMFQRGLEIEPNNEKLREALAQLG